jgi:WD40 repeat protein
MADGVVSVWDAGALLRGEGELAQVSRVERHKAAVRSVQFNPHAATSHLLAAGSAAGAFAVLERAVLFPR